MTTGTQDSVPGPPVIAIVGPTASGKSDLGIRVARSLRGEIINADSMQVYVGMDIGTAKLSRQARGEITHHLLDEWPVSHSVTVAEYQGHARSVVDELRSVGTTPVLVGGSGLYVRAVVDDLRFPGTDPIVRARLEAELEDLGSGVMHTRLAALDPAAGSAILPSNGRRIVRALEVIEMTGSFTATLPDEGQAHDFYPAVRIGLDIPRDVLDARIEARVDAMWEHGLVDEVRQLVASGLRAGRTASRALGYAQVLRYLDGDLSEAQARDETVRLTRRFARRQDSWFRRDNRVVWLGWDSPDLLAQSVAVIKQFS